MSSSWRFQYDWRFAVLLAVLLPTMLSLGFWQLRRAEENRSLLAQAEARRAVAPVLLSADMAADIRRVVVDRLGVEDWQLRAVMLKGRWRDEQFLLENQMHDGRNGYHVLAVMEMPGVGAVLVNRGWVVAPATRAELPVVPAPVVGAQEIAELYMPPHIYGDEPLFAEAGWPKRIGRLQLSGVARELGQEILPVVIRLRDQSPSALTAQWPVVNIAPEKNTAYAIQWFAMSAALLLCYLAVSLRRTIETPRE